MTAPTAGGPCGLDRVFAALAEVDRRAAAPVRAADVAAWGRAQLAEFTGSDRGRSDHVLAYADGILARVLLALDGEEDPGRLRFTGPMPLPPRVDPAPEVVEHPVLPGQRTLDGDEVPA